MTSHMVVIEKDCLMLHLMQRGKHYLKVTIYKKKSAQGSLLAFPTLKNILYLSGKSASPMLCGTD